MLVAPIHDFRAIDVAYPAPARKMPEPEVAHGHMGHDAQLGPLEGQPRGMATAGALARVAKASAIRLLRMFWRMAESPVIPMAG